MLYVIRCVGGGALLLLIMPLAVWLSGWQWQPGGNETLLRIVYFVSQSANVYGAIFLGVLLTVLLRARPALVLLGILFATVSVGMGVKSLLKEQVREARPYVVWLEETQQITPEQFYEMKRHQRSDWVKTYLAQETRIPAWLRAHWAKETGYAFPSGHSMFAACWALLACVLLWPARRYIALAMIMLWAVGVMGSRLLLGMHWPQDLAMSVLIAAMIVVPGCWLIRRWCTLPARTQPPVLSGK